MPIVRFALKIVQNYINPIILFLPGCWSDNCYYVSCRQHSIYNFRGDPNHVAEAKKRISNALLALVAWLLIYAFLQWIIPGGLLS